MGKAENWQQQLIDATSHMGITYLNPRREDWDPSWKQTSSNEKFVGQVNWELDLLTHPLVRPVFYFDPSTISPVSLLELGYCHSRTIAVCCPTGYFRRGNVEIFCNRTNTTLVDTFEQLIEATIDYALTHYTK